MVARAIFARACGRRDALILVCLWPGRKRGRWERLARWLARL
jgi:hypothetical protein